MSRILLDTSALLAHFFNEPGGPDAAAAMGDSEVLLSVVSRVEVHGRLRAMDVPDAETEKILNQYAEIATRWVEVDTDVARRAGALRSAATGRLPVVDALIAASASLNDARLLHRDPHFAGIPPELLEQVFLGRPAGSSGVARGGNESDPCEPTLERSFRQARGT